VFLITHKPALIVILALLINVFLVNVSVHQFLAMIIILVLLINVLLVNVLITTTSTHVMTIINVQPLTAALMDSVKVFLSIVMITSFAQMTIVMKVNA